MIKQLLSVQWDDRRNTGGGCYLIVGAIRRYYVTMILNIDVISQKVRGDAHPRAASGAPAGRRHGARIPARSPSRGEFFFTMIDPLKTKDETITSFGWLLDKNTGLP